MTEFRFIEQNYDYRDYTAVVVQPAKWQITTKALRELKEFILKVEFDYMNDWRLTKRQNQLMNFLAQGQSLRDIAKFMGIAITSVKSHLAAVYNTYGVNDKLNAVLTFLENTEETRARNERMKDIFKSIPVAEVGGNNAR